MTNKTPTQRARDKYFQLHKSAHDRNIEFDLNLDDVKALLSHQKCFYTGIYLTACRGNSQRQTDRTIDRIDANKGYVKGNVVACSRLANYMKERWIESDGAPGLDALVSFVETVKRAG